MFAGAKVECIMSDGWHYLAEAFKLDLTTYQLQPGFPARLITKSVCDLR